MRLATCTYQEFQPAMGVPIRTTVGSPRFKLGYQLAGHATLITPPRSALKLPRDAFTLIYRRGLDAAGVDQIRYQLAQLAGGKDQRLVLLCFDRLDRDGVWCHRTIFREYWQERTGEPVPELGAHPAAPAPTLFDH